MQASQEVGNQGTIISYAQNIISRSQQAYVVLTQCGQVVLRLGKDLRGEQKEEGVNRPRTAMLLISIWFVSK